MGKNPQHPSPQNKKTITKQHFFDLLIKQATIGSTHTCKSNWVEL
jgi:hypothetical protein